MGRFLITHGVNHLVPHHSMSSIRGTRRYDHPQFFSPQCAWFEHLPQLNYELGRLSEVTAQGKMRNRVLFLDPQITGFALSRKSDCQGGDLMTLFSQQGPIETQRTHDQLRRATNALAQDLAERQVDFDIGDEYLMEDHASVTDDGQLRLGEQSYELIVWPDGMTHIRKETADILETYLEAGGALIGVRPTSLKESGRASDRLERWEARFADQCLWLEAGAVSAAVADRVPPRIEVRSAGPGVYHQRREWADAVLWLLINVGEQPAEVTLPESGGDCVSLPLCEDGTAAEGTALRSHRLSLPPQSARLIVQGDFSIGEARFEAEAAAPQSVGDTTLAVDAVTPDAPNVLVVDRCELELAGQVTGPMEARVAGAHAWGHHGLPESGWCGIIQYRQQVMDRVAGLPAGSGYALRYSFELADGFLPESLQLGIDTPEYWRVTVNGTAVDFSNATAWIDPCMRRTEVGPLLQTGSNTVRLEQFPFDVRAEANPVYLIGDFRLSPTPSCFRIEAPRPLGLGSWSAQGWPFFDRSCVYTVTAPEDGTLRLPPVSWRGSWLIAESPSCRRQVDSDTALELPVRAGEVVRLRVVGLPHNLFGPFHVKPEIANQGEFSCAPFWSEPCAETGPRPGEAYRVLDLGLLKAPLFRP
jgi:hypothetical protein